MTKAFLPAGLILLGIAVLGIAQQNPARPQPAKPAQPKPATTQPAAPAQPRAAQPAAAPSSAAARAKDHEAVVAVIGAMDKAFNARDAKALAALFSADAEIVDEEGTLTHGRDAIQEVFAEVFEEFPQARLETDVKSLRFVSPTVAVEEGYTSATYDPKEPPVHNRYVVVHVKEGGKWLMASARDYPEPVATGSSELAQLDWIVGDWADESEDSLILTSYEWE